MEHRGNNFCGCPCHSHARATYNAAIQHERWSDVQDAKQNPMLNVRAVVDTADVLAAALACPLCLANHCEALSYRGIWSNERVRAAWVDPDPPKIQGEGPE